MASAKPQAEFEASEEGQDFTDHRAMETSLAVSRAPCEPVWYNPVIRLQCRIVARTIRQPYIPSPCTNEEPSMAARFQLGGRRPLAVTGLVLLLGSWVLGPASPSGAADDAVEARMRKDITFLASDECEGRGAETKGINLAADYIAGEFEKSGLKPGVEGKS